MVSPTRSTLLDDIREFWKSPLKRGVLFLTGFTALWFCLARFFPGARNVPFGIPLYMCMFVCLTAMICLINAQINYSSKKRLGKSKTFIITCATVTAVIVGILFWRFWSYGSYYSAMEYAYMEESQRTYDSIVNIVASESTDEEKKARLKKVKIKKRSEITLLKNGDIFYSRKAATKYSDYYVKGVITDKEIQDIVVGDDTYSMIYAYYNKPYFPLGIARSITLCSFDYLLHYYERFVLGKSEKEAIKYDSNGIYFRDKHYERSINFWLVFVIVYLLLIVLIYFYIFKQADANFVYKGLEQEKQKLSSDKSMLEEALKKEEQARKELMAKNIELKRFELVYNMMLRNIKHHVEQEPVQTLQEVQFSWRDVMEKKISMGRHAIKNVNESNDLPIDDKMLQRFIEFTDDAVIQPTVEKILQKLREVVNLVDTELTSISTKELYSALESYLLNECFDDKMSKRYVSVKVSSNNLSDHGKCITNMQIMKNIIENLTFNTRQVLDTEIERIWEESEEELDDLKYHVNVLVYEENENFVIRYSDDVKGFPDDILDIIYHEPLNSSKDKGRKGEGTMYVSFFIDEMGGYVQAENGMSNDGRKEAVTTLYLPLIREA